MRISSLRLAALAVVFSGSLGAWSPRFHENQTLVAVKLLPKGMALYLQAQMPLLVQGARGQSSDQVPTVEEVEDQYRRIILLTEQHRRPDIMARELGILAHQVQLLMDPSAIRGATPLRDSFEAYGDEKLAKLILTREPFWAVTAPLDPRPPLLQWAKIKYERNTALRESFDEAANRRLGPWDELSVPFAQLQLAYSNGIHATANLWIQLWRAVGDQWDQQEDGNAPANR